MGFNKRFVNGPGIMAAFKNKGIEGVDAYFNKPDALIVPIGTWAAKVEQTMRSNPEELEDMVIEGIEQFALLKEKAIALTGSLATADTQITAYIQANLENIDKKLGFYK